MTLESHGNARIAGAEARGRQGMGEAAALSGLRRRHGAAAAGGGRNRRAAQGQAGPGAVTPAKVS